MSQPTDPKGGSTPPGAPADPGSAASRPSDPNDRTAPTETPAPAPVERRGLFDLGSQSAPGDPPEELPVTGRFVAAMGVLGVGLFLLSWFVVFTASFLLDVVPHGGAW